MTTGRRNRKEEIVEAAIRLVARQGVSGASVRQIASQAGVTEGALYRHFQNKEDLCRHAYQRIVADMAGQKEAILPSPAPLATKLRDWVRATFDYFDRYPEAFTYVLLTDHEFPADAGDITRRQGRTLTELMAAACRDGGLSQIDPVVAMSHFSGVMLNIPRLINAGILPPPAQRYTESVVHAVCAMLGVEAGERGGP